MVIWRSIPIYDRDNEGERTETEEDDIEQPSIIPEEFNDAVPHLLRGKVADPNGVPNEVLAIMVRKAPGNLLLIY